jgi:hypothetical protein
LLPLPSFNLDLTFAACPSAVTNVFLCQIWSHLLVRATVKLLKKSKQKHSQWTLGEQSLFGLWSQSNWPKPHCKFGEDQGKEKKMHREVASCMGAADMNNRVLVQPTHQINIPASPLGCCFIKDTAFISLQAHQLQFQSLLLHQRSLSVFENQKKHSRLSLADMLPIKQIQLSLSKTHALGRC